MADMQQPDQYRQELVELARKIPAYEELIKFLKSSQNLDASPASISIVRFSETSTPDFASVHEDELPKHLGSSQTSNLFIIENVSANVVELLGSRYGVGHDFWLDHIANSNWFRLGDIEKHLPALVSVRLESRHVRHRFIGPRELLLRALKYPVNDRILPEKGSTRVPRIAGALNPLERIPDRLRAVNPVHEHYPSLALTRQHVSMWFDVPEDESGWRTGILLLDPPFQPQRELAVCQNPSYRSFVPRTASHIDFTYRASFIECLGQNVALRKGGIPCPFVAVGDMYRIIASEWVVVNTCFQRDLNTIELCLEHEEDPSLERLHRLLKALYKIRRRMTLYEVLIKEQREACRQHGRRHWNRPTSTGTSALADVQKTLETDFAFVADQVTKNQERVAKNISLLMTLISVAESRIGIANGKRVEALTLAAIFLVPFSLVSSVMNINGDLGPGGARQYVFWVISVPFSALLGLGYMYYSRSLAS